MLQETASTFCDHYHRVRAIEPRMLTKREAAEYCRICPSTFQTWIDQRLVPGPLPGTKRYDRVALDRAIDKLSGVGDVSDPESAYEAWKAMS